MSPDYQIAQEGNVNWQVLSPLLATAVVAITGWFIASGLAASRDRRAKRRGTRVAYLIEAYRRLESVCHRNGLGEPEARSLESALADIQLFGTASQIALAREFVSQYTADKHADVDRLLADLRVELRSELGLDLGTQETFFLRVTFGEEEHTQSISRSTKKSDSPH